MEISTFFAVCAIRPDFVLNEQILHCFPKFCAILNNKSLVFAH